MLLDKEVDVIVQKSLVFHNNLRNIDILDVDKDVVLATTANNNGKYQLYNTTIRTTGKIVFQAKYLEPICNESDKPVRIESSQSFEFPDDMVIKPLGRSDRFIIATPNGNKFPFAKYQSNEEFTEEKNTDSAFLALRNILRWFYGGKTGAVNCPIVLIDTVQRNKRLVQEMLGYLLDAKVLSKDGVFYKLDSEVAKKHNIGYVVLQSADGKEKMKPFLDAFVKRNG